MAGKNNQITVSECIKHLGSYSKGLKDIRAALENWNELDDSVRINYPECECKGPSCVVDDSSGTFDMVIAKYSVYPNFLPKVIFGYHPVSKNGESPYFVDIKLDGRHVLVRGEIGPGIKVDDKIEVPDIEGDFKDNLDSISKTCREILRSFRFSYPISWEE